MSTSNASIKSVPVWGTLSVTLAPLGLLLVLYFAAGAGWGVVHPRWFIVFSQYLLLVLLGSGLVSSAVGLVRGEQPRWLSFSGLILTLLIIISIAVFLLSLDD